MDGKKTNPVRDQDRVRDLFEHFEQYGDVMFRQQRAIYDGIEIYTRYKTVLEAGCGNGVGAAILAKVNRDVVATDISERNIRFAACLYPWIKFRTWDATTKWPLSPVSEVVAVEMIEHVADPELVIKNLIAASTSHVWISTPNGHGKAQPPDNPYHVYEYTIADMLGMILQHQRVVRVNVYPWDNLSRPAVAYRDVKDPMPSADPLVYKVVLQ